MTDLRYILGVLGILGFGCSGDASGNSDGSGGSVAVGGTPATAVGGATTGSGSTVGGAVSTKGGSGSLGGKSGGNVGGSTRGDRGGASSSGGTTGSARGGQSNKGGASASAGTSSSAGATSRGGATAKGGSGAGGGSSASCPNTVLKPGDTTQTLLIGGATRSYILHVPPKYDGSKPVPLIVDFHPLSGSGDSERGSSPYPAQVDSEGVIMAFPTGLLGPSRGAWNVGPCCVANTDDVAFSKAVVAQIQKSACIDPARIYAVGFSMGGGMSHYLACHAADVFAAVAPAAFDLLQQNVGTCKPARPITVVSFRGTADPVVSYSGGASSAVPGMPVNFLGAKATFQKWAELNQCSGTASAEDSKGCSSYSGCKDGVDVVLCTKQGGGHDAGNASVAWPILKRHTLK